MQSRHQAMSELYHNINQQYETFSYDPVFTIQNSKEHPQTPRNSKHKCSHTLNYFPRKACTACTFEASKSLVQPSYKACLTYKKDLTCHRPKQKEPHVYQKWPQNRIYKVMNIKNELNSNKLFEQYGAVSTISAANATRSIDFSFQAPIINSEISFTQIQPRINYINKIAPKRVSSAFSYTGAAVVKYSLDESLDQKAHHYMSDISYSSNFIDKFCHTDEFMIQKLRLKLLNREQPLNDMYVRIQYLEYQADKIEEKVNEMIIDTDDYIEGQLYEASDYQYQT